jgi:hypothetical protein
MGASARSLCREVGGVFAPARQPSGPSFHPPQAFSLVPHTPHPKSPPLCPSHKTLEGARLQPCHKPHPLQGASAPEVCLVKSWLSPPEQQATEPSSSAPKPGTEEDSSASHQRRALPRNPPALPPRRLKENTAQALVGDRNEAEDTLTKLPPISAQTPTPRSQFLSTPQTP